MSSDREGINVSLIQLDKIISLVIESFDSLTAKLSPVLVSTSPATMPNMDDDLTRSELSAVNAELFDTIDRLYRLNEIICRLEERVDI